MADVRKRLAKNVPGEFFVDSTCINCDACRQLAPGIFAEAGDYSIVNRQPANENEICSSYRALLACPTGSIGTTGENRSRDFLADFPLKIEENVYYCGFNSPKSFGGNSYFIQHEEGNWLIDSPKYMKGLADAFESLGGIASIFLTHRDDVADAARYAERFGSKRIIHELERSAQPHAEILLEGRMPQPLGREFLAIPTFGHTEGHCVLLYRNSYLFTGDHLWWSREKKTLSASASVCWYSWDEQIASMRDLLRYTFEWILPGHGQRAKLDPRQMKQELSKVVQDMQTIDTDRW